MDTLTWEAFTKLARSCCVNSLPMRISPFFALRPYSWDSLEIEAASLPLRSRKAVSATCSVQFCSLSPQELYDFERNPGIFQEGLKVVPVAGADKSVFQGLGVHGVYCFFEEGVFPEKIVFLENIEGYFPSFRGSLEQAHTAVFNRANRIGVISFPEFEEPNRLTGGYFSFSGFAAGICPFRGKMFFSSSNISNRPLFDVGCKVAYGCICWKKQVKYCYTAFIRCKSRNIPRIRGS